MRPLFYRGRHAEATSPWPARLIGVFGFTVTMAAVGGIVVTPVPSYAMFAILGIFAAGIGFILTAAALP